MPDFRPVLFVIGGLLAVLALAMMIPALVDLSEGSSDYLVFLLGGVLTLFFAVSIMLSTASQANEALTLRQTFLLTTLSWIVMAGFAALPFTFGDLNLPFTDAYFEAMSALTTTGSTVIVGLERLPRGVLLWRAMLQGMGGVGIIVMGLAILPMLQVGGMQLFRAESSDRSEKVLPRAAQLSSAILGIYVGLVVLCILAFWAGGMTFFDAVCHALPAISTGGFSNYDASFAAFANPLLDWLAILFMFAGGVSFIVYIQALRGRPEQLWRDSQIRWYFWLIAAASALMAGWLTATGQMSLVEALRHGTFNVVSVVTTTGFVSTDYNAWGGFAQTLFFVLMFAGGCTGSTAGGVKMFRYAILFGTMRRQFFMLTHPHGVLNPTFNAIRVPPQVSAAVMAFFFLYGVTLIAAACGLALMGLDFTTALSGAAQALANIGPGLGDVIGPAGNYATLPPGAKWLLSLTMLLGRLELFTVLVILTPSFWRG